MAMIEMKQIEPLVDRTDLLNQPEKLRRIGAESGYLFFAGLLPPHKVNNVRNKILAVCDNHGWIKQGSDYKKGISTPELLVAEGQDPRWQAFYNDVLKIRDFHDLALDENLIYVFKVLFGESVLPHSRNICRLVFPNAALYSTPPHQDNFYIGGSRETWTAWVPCGDCPESLGGLAVAKRSHQQGLLETTRADGPGEHQVNVGNEQVWVSGDYACGDVIILHSLTIHQGRDNLSQDRLRVSCDFRYQPMSDPIRKDSLEPHMNWVTWEDIYDDWDYTDPIKYYWKNMNLRITEEKKDCDL